jgi:hypothetical protein
MPLQALPLVRPRSSAVRVPAGLVVDQTPVPQQVQPLPMLQPPLPLARPVPAPLPPADLAAGSAPIQITIPPGANPSFAPGKEQALAAIMARESGGRNVLNQQGPGGAPLSSASGYFQMIDPTWREAAGMVGIDTSLYPTALSAPFALQKQAAGALFDRYGMKPWAASAPKGPLT